ncbi:hypothetical protein ACLOJK_019241 [Asimina triloba]
MTKSSQLQVYREHRGQFQVEQLKCILEMMINLEAKVANMYNSMMSLVPQIQDLKVLNHAMHDLEASQNASDMWEEVCSDLDSNSERCLTDRFSQCHIGNPRNAKGIGFASFFGQSMAIESSNFGDDHIIFVFEKIPKDVIDAKGKGIASLAA